MNAAILVVSSLSLVASSACLFILVKGAREAQAVKAEVEQFKSKTNRNFAKVKTVLGEMEL